MNRAKVDVHASSTAVSGSRCASPTRAGATPYLMGRLTHGHGVRPETKGVAKRPFERYLRRFTYDTISHSPHLLQFLIDLVGADRVMLGSTASTWATRGPSTSSPSASASAGRTSVASSAANSSAAENRHVAGYQLRRSCSSVMTTARSSPPWPPDWAAA